MKSILHILLTSVICCSLYAQEIHIEKINCNSILSSSKKIAEHQHVTLLLEKQVHSELWFKVDRVRLDQNQKKDQQYLFKDLKEGNYRLISISDSKEKSISNTIEVGCSKTQKKEPHPFKVDVYPNPTTSFLHIKLNQLPKTEHRYEMYSVSGILIKSGMIKDTHTGINIGELHQGFYFLKIINANKVISIHKIAIN